MRLLYIISSLLLFSCTSTPPRPAAKKTNPDLARGNLQGNIKTQVFVNYTYLTDTLTGRTQRIRESELSLFYDEDGYQKESLFRNDSLQESLVFYYDNEHKKIAEDFLCSFFKSHKVGRSLTTYQYDTLGYETTRFSYDFLDSITLINRFSTQYNSKGNIDNITQYQYEEKSWQPFDREVYKYNSQGFPTEKESYYYYRTLWLLKAKEVSKFQKDSLLTEQLFYNYKISNAPSRILYDYNGEEQFITYTDVKDSILQMASYLYTPEGKVSKHIQYDAQGGEQKRIFYLYTPYSKPLEEILYKEGSEQERTVYQYDTQGNIIRKYTYFKSKLKQLTEVKYTYY